MVLTRSSQIVDRQKSIKLLGVILDETLNRGEHIKYLLSKISKSLFSV